MEEQWSSHKTSPPEKEAYEAFCDKGATSVRQLFELPLFWVVFGVLPFTAWWCIGSGFDTFLPPTYANLGGILSILGGLGCAITMAILGDTKRGREVAAHVVFQVRVWGYPLMLAGGLFLGWHWRDQRPLGDGELAQRAAWQACGKMPECVVLATRVNNGSGVEGYLIGSLHK